MTEPLPTVRKGLAIADIESGHLHNAYRKDRDQCGPDDPMVRALRAEILARGHDPDDDPGNHRRAPQAKGDDDPKDNRGPDERDAYRATLEQDHKQLLRDQMRLELDATKLPRTVESEADVATIDAWIKRADDLRREADRLFELAKAPWRIRGQVVDEFFRIIKTGIAGRVAGIQDRKKPYLIAKRRREEAERAAAVEAQRKAAEQQRAREEEARERATAAQREADEAAARLAQVESERAEAQARAEADEAAAVLPEELTDAVDEAEEQLRAAQTAVFEAVDEAAEAGEAADKAEDVAEELSAGSHILPKVGASQLKSVWRARIAKPREFLNAHPLLVYFLDGDTDAALARAAKADPRPTIPGVEFYEDFDVKTDTRRR